MENRPFYQEAIQKLAFQNGKMAFLTGPRQVGKTTLAKILGKKYPKFYYYNWDDPEFQRQWIRDPKKLVEVNIDEKPLLILDELHKAPRWKNHLKGLYDMRHQDLDILVTGSAKLNVFRRGGDSMMGRYFLFHLHPFSLGELSHSKANWKEFTEAIQNTIPAKKNNYELLLRFGGFPDPFLKQSEEYHLLWKKNRLERLIREDLIDLSRVQEMSLLQSMASLLPEKVGSPFSFQSLSEDLTVTHPTIKRWFQHFEQLFYVFSIYPYTSKIARSLKKQPKIYLWDWSFVINAGARFENLVASHLLKTVQGWNDTGKGDFNLCYVRDKEKREVDFLIVKDKKPWMLIECKEEDKTPDPSLYYFSSKLKPEMTLQVISRSGVHQSFDLGQNKKGFVMSADRFLGLLL